MVLSFIIRWCNRNRTTKCLKRRQKRSIDDNLRQLVIIRQDRVLVNLSTCFFTSGSEFFFFTFPKKRVSRAMGNETFYGDGLSFLKSLASGATKQTLSNSLAKIKTQMIVLLTCSDILGNAISAFFYTD